MGESQGHESGARPRLLVVKGTFEQFGGAERDLLNNLPAWTERFEITLATLNLPDEGRNALSAAGIEFLTPPAPWVKPTGGWAEFNALAGRQAQHRWWTMLRLSEQGTRLTDVLANIDAVHVTSGVASLEFCDLVPNDVPLHYHCLEPHRGLYEDVLHRCIDGAPKRNLTLTRLLLGRQRGRDQRMVSRIERRALGSISGNSAWIQERISSVYGVESGILLPTVDISVWAGEQPEQASEYVVTIGGASWVKGTWETLEMLSGTGIALYLIGGCKPGDMALLRKRAAELGVELDIQPRLSQEELVALVKGARAVVSLAHAEPFGLTPIEAQAAGTPALMVDEGGFQHTVEDGVSGRLLPRGDWGAWHEALEQAADLDTRTVWAEAGRENISSMGLTPEDQAETLAGIFAGLWSDEEE